MIICSCNVICSKKIKECLPDGPVKPSVSSILKTLGCSSVCGSCMSNIVKEIKSHYREKYDNQEENPNQ